jgi:hypothetical protein
MEIAYKEIYQILFLKGKEKEWWLRGCNREGELSQNTLHAYLEFPHEIPLY